MLFLSTAAAETPHRGAPGSGDPGTFAAQRLRCLRSLALPCTRHVDLRAGSEGVVYISYKGCARELSGSSELVFFVRWCRSFRFCTRSALAGLRSHQLGQPVGSALPAQALSLGPGARLCSRGCSSSVWGRASQPKHFPDLGEVSGFFVIPPAPPLSCLPSQSARDTRLLSPFPLLFPSRYLACLPRGGAEGSWRRNSSGPVLSPWPLCLVCLRRRGPDRGVFGTGPCGGPASCRAAWPARVAWASPSSFRERGAGSAERGAPGPGASCAESLGWLCSSQVAAPPLGIITHVPRAQHFSYVLPDFKSDLMG